MTLIADPFAVASQMSQAVPAWANCKSRSPRHHFVYTLVSAGAEPRVAMRCAHCGKGNSFSEPELPTEEVKRLAGISERQHERLCRPAPQRPFPRKARRG